MTCKNCGNILNEGQKFCNNCGTQAIYDYEEEAAKEEASVLEEEPMENAPQEDSIINDAPPSEVGNTNIPTANNTSPQKAATRKSKKSTVLAVIIVLVLIVTALNVVLVVLKKKASVKADEKQYTFYIKENSVYYMDPKEDEPVLITDSFFKNSDEVDLNEFYDINTFAFSKDGKKLFYAEKLDEEEVSFSLYCKQMNKPEQDPIKLAENVQYFTVSDDGSLVIYIDTDGNLYRHNLTEREKILSEIEDFWVSEDCQSLAYLTEDGGLYHQMIDGEKDKLDSNVDSVEKISDDLKTIYYIKEKELFVKSGDNDKTKIDTEVKDVVKILENGEVYFIKDNEKQNKTLSDYVSYSEKQQQADKNTISSFSSYDGDCLKYNEARYRAEAYKILQEKEVDRTDCSLYYYNGKKVNLINSSYVGIYDTSDSALTFKSYDKTEVKKITIEDFVDTLDKEEGFRAECDSHHYYNDRFYNNEYKYYDFFDEFYDMVLGSYDSGYTTYYVKGGNCLNIENKSGEKFLISKDSSKVYYLSNIDNDKETADIYMADIVDNAIQSNDLFESEISTSSTFAVLDVGVIYFKDCKKRIGDMYIDKKLVDYDIGSFSILSDNSVIYYVDYDEDTGAGTIYLYKDGEKTKISEDAFSASEDADGNILYYKDYSQKTHKGDLYIYKNNESEKVDYDVSWKQNVSTEDKYHYFISDSFFNMFLNYSEDDEEEDSEEYYYDDDEDSGLYL